MAEQALRNGPDPLADDPVVRSWALPAQAGGAPKADFIVGVGLGQAGGPAGLAVLERARTKPPTYALTHLKTWPAGTSYLEVATYIAARTAADPLRGARVVLDGGLGPAVVAMFRRGCGAARLLPILATADGSAVGCAGSTALVPGAFLASAVLAVLQGGRLKAAGSLPELQKLTAGLRLFGERAGLLTRLNAQVWNPAEDDPLVQATTLALYDGERQCRIVFGC
jgi:hypothetical protein